MIISPSGKIKFKPNLKSQQNPLFSAKKINLPADWWNSDHSYQSILKDKQIKKTLNSSNNYNKFRLKVPKPNYWEIKHGDYKKKGEAKTKLDNLHFKKDLLSASFSIAVIISVLIIIAFSYLIARI